MKNGLVVDRYGTQQWYVRGQRHRTDGPAYIYADGRQVWYVRGQRHRTDGPAYIGANGTQEWYVNGENITEEVNTWIDKNAITYPFDEDTAVLFCLTYV